jgi:prolyl oligopeptidase
MKRALLLTAAMALGCQAPGGPGPATKTTPVARLTPKQTAPPSRPAAAAPPLARRQPIVDRIHGRDVADPYRWLEDLNNEGARQWMEAHDRHTRRYLAQLPGRTQIAARLKQLMYIDWLGTPWRRGKRFFFSRRHADREKVVHYWRQGKQGDPRVLIDPNTLSTDGSISVKGLSVSWTGEKAAYKLSRNNADHATLVVRDVKSGVVSPIDRIEGARYAQASWTPKGDGFFYTRIPTDKTIPASELPGHAAVYFHKLGTDPGDDLLVHAKTGDPRTFISAEISRDGRFLLLYISHGWARTDVYSMDLRREGPFIKGPDGALRARAFKPFAVGHKARFGVTVHKDRFYVQTDLGAKRYRLFRVDPRRPQRAAWKEIVAEQPVAVLKSFSIAGGRLALHYMRKAQSELRIATLAGKPLRKVALEGLGSVSALSGHPDDDEAYFSFSSFTRPTTIYRTSVRKGGREVYFQLKVPVDPRPYLAEQVTYSSKDGTKVTMFIVRRRDLKRDGKTPFLLYGYGGFNISQTPGFRPTRFLWLEQGGALAIPNLRGGGEYGEAWHEAAMLTRKQNTFDDFIAAAQWLIRAGYTRADKLVIRGGSNGGLLVGAAMVQRPELFHVVACHVPLLDMVRYHRFGSGKTWISEYGSADDPKQFAALWAYSPYHHVKPRTAYPALLMMSADSDDRVDPMHARKFTAAIRHASTSGRKVLLRVETKAGHGGGDMIKKAVEAGTDEFSFLFSELGMPVNPR